MDKNLDLIHLTHHISRWIGNMTEAAISGNDLSKEKLETDPEVIRIRLQPQISSYPKTLPPMAPELIQDFLQAMANSQTCPPDEMKSAIIILDWMAVAQKILSGSFDEADIQALIALGIRGATSGYLVTTGLLETFNIRILIKIERYKEAIETIERIFASDDLIQEGYIILSLSRCLLVPNILVNLKKETLLQAINLSSKIEPIIDPAQIRKKFQQFRRTLQQQLDKL